jgi:hypothetical protein
MESKNVKPVAMRTLTGMKVLSRTRKCISKGEACCGGTGRLALPVLLSLVLEATMQLYIVHLISTFRSDRSCQSGGIGQTLSKVHLRIVEKKPDSMVK